MTYLDKDLFGNIIGKKIYSNNLKTLGSSNHTKEHRENTDFYATDPKAVELLLQLETFKNVLEPFCGKGHISKVLINNGINVTSSDLIYRGYGKAKNFYEYKEWNGDIVSNPPYSNAKNLIHHALRITKKGNKIAMFLKLLFLESKNRKPFFEMYPPKVIYVSGSRLQCAKNGNFNGSNAIAYGWFIWEVGNKKNTILKWFN